jgi:hypothetical protein
LMKISYVWSNNPIIMVQWLAFLLHILEVLYLNLSLNVAIFTMVHYGYMPSLQTNAEILP